ncbi:MAG TPA: 2-dehydro-3-deoxygalactonokinase [Steroidobacteraceae bacterium]|jgi:2-dehydro-3-deoxygalactonokinase
MPRYVAGDWGTSNLRLFLCDSQGSILESAVGPGVSSVKDPFEDVFESLLKDWETRFGALPAVLSGMIGSSIGWVQTPYVSCPAIPQNIAAGCIALRAGRVHIVPGLRCENRLHTADFMRGEETQVLGALALDPVLGLGKHLLCLPGTHTKWVVIENGVIQEFLTSVTGELFGALRDHSVLVRAEPINAQAGSGAFAEGVARCNDYPSVPILHRLFECRSRVLSGELPASHAADFLSGLLIASDIAGALNLFDPALAKRSLRLIGAPQLTKAYAAALKAKGLEAIQIDGSAAALAGLTSVHRHLSSQVRARAG